MNWILMFSVVTIVGSLALMAYRLKRPTGSLRSGMLGAFAMFCLGVAMLGEVIITAGIVQTITQLVFSISALWLLSLEIRSVRSEKQHGTFEKMIL